MRIIANDDGGNTLSTTLPHENLWIEVEKEGGEKVYVGSLYFDQRPDGSLVVQWGSARNAQESWDVTDEVIVPAAELTAPTTNEGAPA